MELPLPSVTTLPVWPEPAGTFAGNGASAFLKVTVLPLMFSVEPSWISVPSVVEAVVRALVTVALPPPTEVVNFRAFSRSASPVMLRSAPVPVVKVTIPPAIAALVPDELENAAVPFVVLITAF
jgi:hypothetical protein